MSLLVFDLSGLVHRAWHGQPHAAGRLALDWMAKHIDQRQPSHVAAAVDRPFLTWRHELAESRGSRPYKPPEKRTGGADRASIMRQMRIAEELAEDVLGMRVFGVRGFEGDDVVATLARLYEGSVLIAARDKDFCQLVTERVRLLDFATGLVTHAADVEVKFGVPPSRFVDYLALVGDKTDGFAGCPGIGPKAAVALVREFRSIAEMLTYADAVVCSGRMTQTMRRRLLTGADALQLSHALALLRADVPLRLGSVEELRALPLPEGLP